MCLTGTLLHSVLVVLLLANSSGKSRCNYKDILGFYREVIFVELQNLNLTVSHNSSKVRDPCPSAKAHRILVSIYKNTQQILCLKSSKKLSDLKKPIENMEQLIVQNCSPNYMGQKAPCSSAQKIQGRKGKRFRVIKTIKALITCWEKLKSVVPSDK